MNVVQQWRERSLLLHRKGWQCQSCRSIALARRRACARCGARSPMVPAALPRTGTVIAATSGGMAIDELEQIGVRRHSVALSLAGGIVIACLVADSDTALVGTLHGRVMQIGIRRSPDRTERDDPIRYVFKAFLPERARRAVLAEVRSKGGKDAG